jgi:hypothetical protein
MALEMKSKDFFFRDHTRIGWFFARPRKTLIIFLVSGLSICLLVWLVSTISGKPLGSLPKPHDKCDGCNVGFFYRPNWGLMYAIMLPVIFTLMSSILVKSRLAVNALSSAEIRVISPARAGDTQGFEDSLYLAMRVWKVWIYLIASAAAVTATGWTVYLLRTNPSATGDDWAGQIPQFAIFVFIIQGIYIFLGVFWVLKFTSFVVSFIRLAVGRTTGFRLNPMLYDPTRRMGLGIMGGLLNQFAVATLLFESYVAIYGIQAAADTHKLSLGQYFQETLSSTKLSQLFSLADFPRPFHFSGAGVFALVALSVLLWIVYIAIPVFCLCPRLIRMRKNTWRHHARRFELANRLNNKSLAKPLDRKFKALAASSFWPNGPTNGTGLAFALLVIPLLAIYPPVGGYLATSGVIAAGYKALKSVA